MKHFLSADDVADPMALAEKALEIKYNPFKLKEAFTNKSICLIFFNPSLRTRLSTELAAKNLGMHISVLNISKDSWNLEFEDGVAMNLDNAEHIRDAAAVIGAYYDILGIRSFPELSDREKDYSEYVIKSFVQYSGIPVVNLESATVHPLQSLADLITIRELVPVKKPKIVLSWAPHPRKLPQAVPNSFAEWMLKAGMDLTITHPKGFDLHEKFTEGATISYNQKEAVENADIVYVKNWSSYKNYGETAPQLNDWMITRKLLENTNGAKVLHCLPVRRNVVIEEDVLDSPQSIIIEQAKNRICAAQAVLQNILSNE